MRVAFVHDWLVTYRGGEKVLTALLELYPEAPIFTLFYDKKAMPPQITDRTVVVPSTLNAVRPLRKLLLPLLPRAIESLQLQQFDLIISTSSCVAKGAIKGPGARHLCYIHSPMRYIWDQQDEYIAGVAHIPGAASAIRALTPRLRQWDISSASRVDRFVANSSFVGERVHRLYARDAAVVHPPIATGRFRPSPKRGGYYLAAGALVSYKRFDLAVAACREAGKRLIIAGSGPMEKSLRAQAGEAVEFVISPSDEELGRLMAEAEALLFPGVEDFGMIAVEAMAAGTPVIAYGAGGARDFIVPGHTGVFFTEATAEALAQAILGFDREQFGSAALVEYAAGYGQEHFLKRMRAEIEALMVGGSER
ncbi:MAG: hypothetical protein RL011_1201 [Pseudomonadota bacterium]